MKDRTSLVALLAGIAMAGPASADTDWPYPEDTPTIEPVTVGLAVGSGALIVTGLTLLVLRAPWEDERDSTALPRLTGSIVTRDGGLRLGLEGRW